MKSIIIRIVILTSFLGIILISAFKKPITNEAEKKVVEMQRENRIKRDRTDKFRQILINELELLRKTYKYSAKSNNSTDIIDFILLSESYDFEAENMENTKIDGKYGFDVSFVDTVKNIYDIIDTSIHGKGETVKYCKSKHNEAQFNKGIILNKLIKIKGEKPSGFDLWKKDGIFDYMIIPRIRIDPKFASNFGNSDYPVCLISITNLLGDTILIKNLMVRDFYDNGTIEYDGSYKTEFKLFEHLSGLRLPVDKIIRPRSYKSGNNLMNIEVFYYGYCDMWIDYVRIENMVSYDFLTKQNASLIEKLEKSTGRNILKLLNENN